MVYQLFPGIQIPLLKIGDVLVISGKQFQYRGTVRSLKDIPQVVGVYLCLDNNSYYLHHKKDENKDIIMAYNKHHVENIAKDDNPVTRIPENIEIFTVPIYPEDNFLKMLIKKVLYTLKLDTVQYKKLFMNENHYNNTKRSLTSKSVLSYEKFCELLDLLGLTHTITISYKDGSDFTFDKDIV